MTGEIVLSWIGTTARTSYEVMKMAKVPSKVMIGLKFPYAVADGRCLFTVKELVGKGVWKCVCDDDRDYGNLVVNMDGKVILGILQMNENFRQHIDENEAWFESLLDGSIVHLSHGFGQFVRCMVETGTYSDGRKTISGKHVVAIALVGNWRQFDLPRRQLNGSIYHPYNAKQVVEGEHFRPGAGNMWESPSFQRSLPRDDDPATLEPVSLEVPEMTAEEEHLAELISVRDTVVTNLTRDDDPSVEDLLSMFRAAIPLMTPYLRDEVDGIPQDPSSRSSTKR